MSFLEGMPELVEEFMVDSCTVTRIEDSNRVLNQTTGQYEVTPVTIWSGKCFFGAMGIPGTSEIGNEELRRTWYTVGLPLDCPVLKPYDIIMCDTALNEPNMVGQKFTVSGTVLNTFSVMRQVSAYTDASGS